MLLLPQSVAAAATTNNNNVINTKNVHTWLLTKSDNIYLLCLIDMLFGSSRKYSSERTKYKEIWSSTSTVRFKWVFCNVMCEGKRKWWDMKTVVRLEYAKVLNMISVKLTMRFKRNGRMNPLFVIVTRTPNVIPCLIRHVLSKIVLNHICGAHSVSNLQSPFPSPFDSLLLVFPFY